MYGVNADIAFKHWGCDNVIIDARTKPHHAPPLILDPAVEKRIDQLFAKGGSLGGVLG
jgi:4-hydroxy-3-polyprenylbenzoate decarboxylase